MKIKNNVYYIGELNPNLRVFDIIMKTEYGTSYNSYLVKDNDGDVIIDTVHNKYSDTYFQKIQEFSSINKIKYLIVNHCEPDHSGSIKQLIELNPNIEIYCSIAAKNFLTEITNNKNLKFHLIKDNEELKLSSHTFKFISAPNLHWPDSIFTYLVEEKMVFTCDFLGCHYTEPRIFDHKINYLDKYNQAFNEYFNAIFSPFKSFVKIGLSKLNLLDYQMILPSHGPILTNDGLIKNNIALYDKWSNEIIIKEIPVFYVSAYGYTEKIANAIAEAITESGFQPLLINLVDYDFNQAINILNSCSKFFIGSPTINRKALQPIINLITSMDLINVKNKKGLVFGSFGWTGEAKQQIIDIMKSLNIKSSDLSFNIKFNPNNDDLSHAKLVAKQFLENI